MLGTTGTRPAHPDRRPATMVAVEAMLLRPPDAGDRPTRRRVGPWPVLALVLDEPNELIEPSVRPLFELLTKREQADRITVVTCRCHWSLVGHPRAVLQLSVHATAPVRFHVNIILPAQPILRFVEALTRGATVALTNRRSASRLTNLVPVRDALAELVLLGSPRSAGLPDLVATTNLHDRKPNSARQEVTRSPSAGAAIVSDQDGERTDPATAVAEQLMREFGLIVSFDTVTACVLSAQQDLEKLALRHIPSNLLDQLARARLLDTLDLQREPPAPGTSRPTARPGP